MTKEYPVEIHYPIFTVGSQTEPGTVISVGFEGMTCILLYKNNELAELYVEQALQAKPADPLHVLPIEDAWTLKEGLGRLPANVTHVIWDATFRHTGCRVSSVKDLLDVLS